MVIWCQTESWSTTIWCSMFVVTGPRSNKVQVRFNNSTLKHNTDKRALTKPFGGAILKWSSKSFQVGLAKVQIQQGPVLQKAEAKVALSLNMLVEGPTFPCGAHLN